MQTTCFGKRYVVHKGRPASRDHFMCECETDIRQLEATHIIKLQNYVFRTR